jgi:hypothetical protein
MPKMTHPIDRGHVIDVADEKVAVYQAQGWGVKTEQADKPDDVTAVTRGSLSGPRTRKAAKKAAAPKKSDES